MPVITRGEMKQQIQSNQLHGVYLLEGIEENLKAEAITQIQTALLPEGLEELNLSQLENPSADVLIAAAETLPFMADKRLILVREMAGLASKGEAEERLVDYLSNVPPSTVLVFVAAGKADARKKLYKTILSCGQVVVYNQLTEQELNTWIQAAFHEQGKLCAPATASLLAFTSGTDTTLLLREIDKLCAYVGERSGITDEDVAEMATPSTECRVFDLTDAIANDDQAKALMLLRDLIRNGEQRVGILAMILRQYRIMQQIKIMQYEKRSTADMSRLLGIKDFALKRHLQQVKKISGGEARDGVKICLDYEYRIKSGQISEYGAAEACLLELFALKNRR